MAQSVFVSVALTLRPCHIAPAEQTYVHRQDIKAMWHWPHFAIMQQHLILKP